VTHPLRRSTTTAAAALTCLAVLTACSGDASGDTDQDVALSVLPPISQTGAKAAPADRASGVVSARVSPGEAGREVTLETKDGGDWAEVGATETNGGGTADFVLDDGDASDGSTYRVVVESTGDLEEFTSDEVEGATAEPDFSDEFDGRELSVDWFHRGPDYNPEGLRVCSKGSPDAVDVAGGALQLKVIEDPERADETCEAKKASGKSLGRFAYRLNGHVGIGPHIPFQYGVTAARIKFQQERGQHGSFWLQSGLAEMTSAAESGAEIDVVEYFGEDESDRLASFIHYPTKDGYVKEGDFIEDASDFLTGKGEEWWNAYHVFALEWTKDEYVVRIDGEEAWRTDQGVSQQPEYLVLSLLSSDYELPELSSVDKLPQTMSVDWVRHWQPTDG
jgi:Glycosyl hydrolases family 16